MADYDILYPSMGIWAVSYVFYFLLLGLIKPPIAVQKHYKYSHGFG